MHEKVAEKFAELFAACAVKGEMGALQKEAAAHKLVKSAADNPFVTTAQNVLSSPYVYAPLIGAAGGGALGYGTSKKKDKMRNALHYALMGGLTGLGGAVAAKNLPIFGGGTAASGGKPADGAKPTPEASPVKELMEEHAKKTAPGLLHGQPGTTFAPRAVGTAAAVAGGAGGNALNNRMFRNNVKGELKNVNGEMAATLGHFGDKANPQRLENAIDDLLTDPNDPLGSRGPTLTSDRARVLNNARDVVTRGDLGSMRNPALRSQNAVLMQELSRLGPHKHTPNVAGTLQKYHAGKQMSWGRRGLGLLGVLAGLPANLITDALQNRNAVIPQEQPK